jgi:hypothetical protein
MFKHKFPQGVLSATLLAIATASSPAPVDQHAQVAWSTVQENPFDGKLVYDKHFDDGFAFVTVWSKRWIRASSNPRNTELY